MEHFNNKVSNLNDYSKNKNLNQNCSGNVFLFTLQKPKNIQYGFIIEYKFQLSSNTHKHIVVKVDKNSIAHKSGLKAGDYLISINDKRYLCFKLYYILIKYKLCKL
jgi:hypothetical protein